MVGLAAFVLPNLIIRMLNFILSITYMREKALLLTILFFLPINIAIMYRYRRSQSGINLFASALCSLVCVVILPEDPSRKDREGKSDVDTTLMKKVSFLITIISVPIVFLILISWASYLLVIFVPKLKTDPDILLTHEQYWYIMSTTFTGLFILSIISCVWFLMTYDNHNTIVLPQPLASCLKLNTHYFHHKRWLKMIGDILIIVSTLGLIIVSLARFPKGPNEVVLCEEKENRVFLRDGFTYEDINTTLQCNLGTNNTWLCGNYELKSDQNHHTLSNDDNHIAYLGDQLSMQKYGIKIRLFPRPSKELEALLQNSECVSCVSNTRKCRKIVQNLPVCDNFCTTYPKESKIITKVKTRNIKSFTPLENLENAIRPPYMIGDSVQVQIQSDCVDSNNSFITCQGNNHWELPVCEESEYFINKIRRTSWG